MTHKQTSGFTLVEIMIAMAIIGLIAAIAIPNYMDYTIKSKRSEGYAALDEIMHAQRRFKFDNQTFTEDLTQLGYNDPQLTENGLYEITASTCASGSIASCVLLTATARGGQVNDKNGNGGNMTLNSRETKVGWK